MIKVWANQDKFRAGYEFEDVAVHHLAQHRLLRLSQALARSGGRRWRQDGDDRAGVRLAVDLREVSGTFNGWKLPVGTYGPLCGVEQDHQDHDEGATLEQLETRAVQEAATARPARTTRGTRPAARPGGRLSGPLKVSMASLSQRTARRAGR